MLQQHTAKKRLNIYIYIHTVYVCIYIYTHDRNPSCTHTPELCNLDFILEKKTTNVQKCVYIHTYMHISISIYYKQPDPNSKLDSLYIHEIYIYIYIDSHT